jgi:hypothetical protein
MTKDEALKMALEVMRNQGDVNVDEWIATEKAIKEALEQPEQEPVAFVKGWNCGRLEVIVRSLNQRFEIDQPLYTTPPQRKPLTIEQPKVRTGDCLLVGVCASEGHKIPPQRTWVGLTPACPQGLTEYACEVEGVDLVCFLEYTPDEEGSRDSRGLLDEPGTFENLELVNAYVKGTDIDIGHLLLQGLVDHITTTALEDYKNDDL